MKVTSAKASKLLKSLSQQLEDLKWYEGKTSRFVASVGEDPESIRPEYNFNETWEKMQKLIRCITALKHSINVFNSTTVLPGFDLTIDEALVLMPILSDRACTLRSMKATLPKERVETHRLNISSIDYRYVNYDIAEVEAACVEVSDTLTRLQMALDLVNNSVEFETDDIDV